MKLELLDTKEWTARDELANATSKPSHQVRPRSLTHTAGVRAMGTIIACVTRSTVRPLCLSSRPHTRLPSGVGFVRAVSPFRRVRDQRWRSDSLCASTERGTLRTRLSAATNARPTSAGWRGDSEHRLGRYAIALLLRGGGRRRPWERLRGGAFGFAFAQGTQRLPLSRP
jgi:hypothetical protein